MHAVHTLRVAFAETERETTPQWNHLRRRTSKLTLKFSCCSIVVGHSRGRSHATKRDKQAARTKKAMSFSLARPFDYVVLREEQARREHYGALQVQKMERRHNNAARARNVPLLGARRRSELADRPRIWWRSEQNERGTSNAFVPMQHQS